MRKFSGLSQAEHGHRMGVTCNGIMGNSVCLAVYH